MCEQPEPNEEPSGFKDAVHRSNFRLLIVYQSLLRLGWIFKTESIIMPAVLDSIIGSGWVRGCLPMLNRLGQSLPPIVLADRIRVTKYKKFLLVACAAAMGICFIVLSVNWHISDRENRNWMAFLFLAIYGAFWLFVGIHNLTLSLLYGKLIEITSRGRLMFLATTVGSIVAIAGAWFLMRRWLADDPGDFTWLFAFTGTTFVIAAVLGAKLIELADNSEQVDRKKRNGISTAMVALRSDANFRLLCLVAACYGISITLIPHYQAYVKTNLEIGLIDFVPWVIAQNTGAAVFSIPLGRIADQFGNRLALSFTMFALCFAPILSMLLVCYSLFDTRAGFVVVFFLLGLTPVSMRVFSNYALEITDRQWQPVYLSSLGGCMAFPVVILSAAVGLLIDRIGFEVIFVAILSILIFGWLLTFRLNEPRNAGVETETVEPQKPVLN